MSYLCHNFCRKVFLNWFLSVCEKEYENNDLNYTNSIAQLVNDTVKKADENKSKGWFKNFS